MRQHALVVQLHVKLKTADFTEQHVPFVHHQVQLRPQVVDLLALLVDDLHALLQRNAVGGGIRLCSVAALLRLPAAQSIGGLLRTAIAIVAHVPAVSHNTAEGRSGGLLERPCEQLERSCGRRFRRNDEAKGTSLSKTELARHYWRRARQTNGTATLTRLRRVAVDEEIINFVEIRKLRRRRPTSCHRPTPDNEGE